MDSEDEFDYDVDRIPTGMRSRGLNGFNMSNQYVANTTGTGKGFEAHFNDDGTGLNAGDEDDDDDEQDIGTMGILSKARHQNCTPQQLTNALFKDFLAQDFSDIKRRREEEVGDCFEDFARSMINITDDGGIKKKVLMHGTGEKMQPGQIVYVDYIISYEDGDETLREEKIIDTTKDPIDRGPFRFKIGAGNVIPVLDIALLSMNQYECAIFLATCKYGYGKLGLYQEVPPNTTIMVKIAIMKIVEGCEKSLNAWELMPDERAKLPFDERIKACRELKTYGNDFYNKRQYQPARMKYKLGMKMVKEILTPVKEELAQMTELLYSLLINTAQCRILENEFRKAKSVLVEAVGLRLTNIQKLKAYYRLALCHTELNEFDAARKNIDMAKSIDGANANIDDLYRKLHQKQLQDKQAEKGYAKLMFLK